MDLEPLPFQSASMRSGDGCPVLLNYQTVAQEAQLRPLFTGTPALSKSTWEDDGGAWGWHQAIRTWGATCQVTVRPSRAYGITRLHFWEHLEKT